MNNPTGYQVVAGEHDQSVVEGNEQKVTLSKIIQHEGYDANTISNDISLLKFSTPLSMNDFVQGVALPEAGQAASGDCIVSGWGTLSEGGSTPDVLQKVAVPIVSDEECRDAYGASEIDDSMICAGVPAGGKILAKEILVDHLSVMILVLATSLVLSLGDTDVPDLATQVYTLRSPTLLTGF